MMKRRPHRQWLKTFPGAWTFGLLLACSVQAAESASSSRDGEELGNRLQAAVEDSFVGQVVVGSRQEILWSGVFGAADPATGAAVSRATVFDIGSITKQMTATAVLKLASEGRLKLGDRLGEHSRASRNRPPRSRCTSC